MLIDFTCSNVRSIRDSVTLNLKASNDDEFSQILITSNDERLLPACTIYGSNATGKTSILTAISLMQNIVNSSHVFQPGDLLPRIPHRLMRDKETTLCVNYIWKNIKYKYEFSYTDTEVVHEALYYAPNGRMGKIFERTKMSVKYSDKFTKIDSICKDKLQSNKLVLSLAANNINYEEIQNAFLFFKEGLVILLNDNNNWLDYSASKLEHNKAIKDIFIEFLQQNGSDIQDIKAKTEIRIPSATDVPPDLPPEIRALILTKPTRFTSIQTVYKNFKLDIVEESMGTQKLIRLYCPLIDILTNGKTFFCDEIESHLHPLIIRQIISRFMTDKTTNAQIICATHDVELLDLDFFRRDQIWFTDINPDFHRTKLYPLSSLSCRKEDNIQRKYLESKYCKVPKGYWGHKK